MRNLSIIGFISSYGSLFSAIPFIFFLLSEEILIRIYTKHAEKAHAVQKAFRKRREDILNEIGLRDLAYAPNTRKQDNMSLSPTKTSKKKSIPFSN